MKFVDAMKMLEMGYEIKRKMWENTCIKLITAPPNDKIVAIKIDGNVTSEFTVNGYDMVAEDWGFLQINQWEY